MAKHLELLVLLATSQEAASPNFVANTNPQDSLAQNSSFQSPLAPAVRASVTLSDRTNAHHAIYTQVEVTLAAMHLGVIRTK